VPVSLIHQVVLTAKIFEVQHGFDGSTFKTADLVKRLVLKTTLTDSCNGTDKVLLKTFKETNC